MTLKEKILDWLEYVVEDVCSEDDATELQPIVSGLDDYILVHKSHIEVSQYESLPLYGFMTRAMIQVQAGDIVPMVEIVQSKNGEEHVLKQHREHVVSKLLKYLEAPKPEQTQPAQS